MKYKVGILILAWLSLFILASTDKNIEPINSDFEIIQISKQHKDGKAIIEQVCSTCHSSNLSHEDLLAPPLQAVKDHYMEEGISEEEFVGQLSSYILDPKSENSKMRGAVNRFGVMPKPAITEDEAKEVASYIFKTELESPEWYKEHSKKGHHGKKHHGMKMQHGKKSNGEMMNHSGKKKQADNKSSCKMKKGT